MYLVLAQKKMSREKVLIKSTTRIRAFEIVDAINHSEVKGLVGSKVVTLKDYNTELNYLEENGGKVLTEKGIFSLFNYYIKAYVN